jgi:hypothetical protein
MQIRNDSSTHLSLYHLGLRWAQAATTDYPFAEFVQSANVWLDKVVAVIMRNDNTWEFEDTNNTDLPLATTSIVAAQEDYSLAASHLKILRVRAKDNQGNWVTLQPIQRRQLTDDQLRSTGNPEGYDKLGNSLFLNPIPDYASSGGLELQFQRGGNYFDTDDTTKEPGFASPFHEIIALGAALDFCDINGKDKQANAIRARLGVEPIGNVEGSGLLGALASHYRTRDYDRPQTISLKQSNRSRGLLT